MKSQAYRKAFAERRPEDQVGYRPTEHLSALCPAIVLNDRERARRVGLRGQRFFAEALSHWYQGGPKPQVDDLSPEEQIKALEKVKEQKFAKLGEDKIAYDPRAYGYLGEINDAYGTPQDCINYVQRLFDAGADEIMFLSQMGTVPHEAIMETIELIGTEVIPHFRDKAAAKVAAQ